MDLFIKVFFLSLRLIFQQNHEWTKFHKQDRYLMASPLIMNGILNVPPIYFFYRYLAHPNCSSGFVLETMQVDFSFAISKFRNWYNYFYRESNFEFERFNGQTLVEPTRPGERLEQ